MLTVSILSVRDWYTYIFIHVKLGCSYPKTVFAWLYFTYLPESQM